MDHGGYQIMVGASTTQSGGDTHNTPATAFLDEIQSRVDAYWDKIGEESSKGTSLKPEN